MSQHLVGHLRAFLALEREQPRLDAFGRTLARRLLGGARLLAAGNGGSAAQAQHLTAELVGRYRDERVPLSAIALHAETSAVTAISNDYGYDEVFARQVQAHGRRGDVLLLLSTSGTSANLVAAARTGRRAGLETWAFTGPLPNPLADAAEHVVAVPHPNAAIVQEIQLVMVHLVCEAVDAEVRERAGAEHGVRRAG